MFGVQPEQVAGTVLPLDLAQVPVIYTVSFPDQAFAVFVVAGHVEMAAISFHTLRVQAMLASVPPGSVHDELNSMT